MTSATAGGLRDTNAGLLSRERIVAKAGFNRWLVPPAALAIHPCIDMAYGFSVFWVPLGRAGAATTGAAKPIACPGDPTTFWGKVGIAGRAFLKSIPAVKNPSRPHGASCRTRSTRRRLQREE